MKKSKKTLLPLFYKKKPRRLLSEKQKKLLKFNLKKFLFKKNFSTKKKIFLEIGFGYGENLINLSINNNNKIIIGCEIYEPGLASTIDKIEKKKLKNILIYPKNIFTLIDELKRNSIDKVFMLYPDPWPKKKHFKRRLISKIFLKRLHKILKKNGMTLISTDSLSYLCAIFYEFSLNPNFEWANKDASDCYKRPLEMIKSKYERKADIEGNDKYFLKFKKIC